MSPRSECLGRMTAALPDSVFMMRLGRAGHLGLGRQTETSSEPNSTTYQPSDHKQTFEHYRNSDSNRGIIHTSLGCCENKLDNVHKVISTVLYVSFRRDKIVYY